MPLGHLKAAPVQQPANLLDKLVRAQFRSAAEVAVHDPVDLNNIGGKTVVGMPSALTTQFHFDDLGGPAGQQQFTMEFMEGDVYFGAITAEMNVSHGKIRLSNMQYDTRGVRGFAPYALRHLVSVFQNFKNLVVATGVMADLSKLNNVDAAKRLTVAMAEHAKLKHFDAIGFTLVEERTQQRIALPDANSLVPCRAVLDFDDTASMDVVRRNLEIQKPASQPKREGSMHYQDQPALVVLAR